MREKQREIYTELFGIFGRVESEVVLQRLIRVTSLGNSRSVTLPGPSYCGLLKDAEAGGGRKIFVFVFLKLVFKGRAQ